MLKQQKPPTQQMPGQQPPTQQQQQQQMAGQGMIPTGTAHVWHITVPISPLVYITRGWARCPKPAHDATDGRRPVPSHEPNAAQSTGRDVRGRLPPWLHTTSPPTAAPPHGGHAIPRAAWAPWNDTSRPDAAQREQAPHHVQNGTRPSPASQHGNDKSPVPPPATPHAGDVPKGPRQQCRCRGTCPNSHHPPKPLQQNDHSR